jgi:hypothetical protein
MLAKIKLWIAGAALAASIVIGAFFAGNINGKTAAKASQEKQAAESLRKARTIEKASDDLPIADVRKRIAGRLRD